MGPACAQVEPGGGASYVCPQSHAAVHRYYCKYPEDLRTGGAMNNAVDRVCHGLRTANKTGMSAEFMEATCPGGYDGEGPVEGCMKKGVRAISFANRLHVYSPARPTHIANRIC